MPPYPARRLTLRDIDTKPPGLHCDGHGLYLRIDPPKPGKPPYKAWVQRLTINGKRVMMGLGPVRLVTLTEARAVALKNWQTVQDGGDPRHTKALQRAEAMAEARRQMTFADAAEQCWQGMEGTWKNDKHRQQWITTLRTYAVPSLGAMPLEAIQTPDITRALEPIWLTKHETAKRTKQRISTVFDWALSRGHRTGGNPVAGATKGLPRPGKAASVRHHPALPWREVPALIPRLLQKPTPTTLALLWIIATAARSGEALGACWAEIDRTDAVWTVPAERMKAGRDHRVPLSPLALRVLDVVATCDDPQGLVFAGRGGKALSDMTLLMWLRRRAVPAVPHGFRTSFRVWAAEATDAPREVAEAALAHTIPNAVERAYNRTDLFDRRRALMADWARFLMGEVADA